MVSISLSELVQTPTFWNTKWVELFIGALKLYDILENI